MVSARILALLCLILSRWAFAIGEGPQTLTLSGQLFSTPAATTVLSDPNILFKIQILDPSKSCILYEETQSISTATTNGYFTIYVGSPTTGSASSKRSSNDSANTMATVYQNVSSMTGKLLSNGSACTYTPTNGDDRYFRLYVTPSTTSVTNTLSPDMILDSVPMATVAEALQGIPSANILLADSTTSLNQSNLANVFSTTNYSKLTSLLSGSSTQYVPASSSAGAELPSYTSATPPTGLAAGSIWYDSTDGVVKYYNGSTSQTLGTSGAGLSSLTVGSNLTASGTVGGTLTSPGTIDLATTGVSANTYTKVTVDTYGRVTSGAQITGSDITSGTIGGSTAFSSSGNITTTGTVTGATVSATNLTGRNIQIFDSGSNKITLQTVNSLPSSYTLTLPSSVASQAGQMLTSDTSGNLSWTTPSTGSVTSVSVTSPITNSGSASAPNISIQQANTSQSGYLSSADWNTFNGKLTSTLASGDVFVGNSSNVATAVAPTGDVSLTNAGAFTVTQVQGTAVSSTAPTAAGEVLRYNGSTQYAPSYIGIADIRSTVSGNAQFFPENCTSSQTMTYSAVTDTYSCTAITASSGTPISGLTAATGTNTIDNTTYAQTWNWSTATTQSPITINANSLTTGSALKIASSSSSLNSTSGLLDVANTSTSTNGTLATFQSNSTAGSGMTILTSGNVGIGTTAPGFSLQVKGNGSYTGYTGTGGIAIANSSNPTEEIYMGYDSTLGPVGSGYIQAADVGVGFTNLILEGAAGNVGIGTTNPGSALDVNGTLRLDGSTSGYSALKSPATAGSVTWTLPSADGTNGQVLSTNGAGTLSWASGNSGSVTSVSSGTGLTGGPITTTGTLSLASIANNTILANTSGSSAAPTATAISPILDSISSTQGSVLYRGSSTWSALAPGTSGQVLQSGGSAANPSWVTPAVTSGVSVTAPITNSGTAAAPNIGITLASGDIFVGNASSVPTAVAASGDVSMTNTGAFTVKQIQGTAVSSTAPTAAGQVLRYNGSTQYAPSYIGIADIRSTVSGNAQFFPENCTSSQTMTYSAVTDTYSCTTITSSSGTPISGLTAATATNTIDNTTYAQTWNWSTATTQSPLTINANSLTTGTALKIASSSSSLNSTSGLLDVANTSTSTNGMLARFQSNSTSGSGMTILTSGNVGIGTTSPKFELSLGGDGGIYSVGTYGSGASLGTIGAVTGMIWYPQKGAFRVGASTTSQWDDTNTGGYSFSAGSANTASGLYSFAAGNSNTASGAWSIAMGYDSSATSTSTAIGVGAQSSGFGSVAMGYDVEASSYGETVVGYNNALTGAESAGLYSSTAPVFVIGNGTSSGTSSNAMTVLMNGNVGIATTSPGAYLDVNPPATAITSGTVIGAKTTIVHYPTASASASVQAAYNLGGFGGSANNTASVTATMSQMYNTNTAALANGYAAFNYVQNASTGTITNAMAASNTVQNIGAGTVTYAYGDYVQITNTGGGTVNNSYGVYIDTSAGSTNKYGLYQVDSSTKNYFGGKLGIGTNNPSYLLQVLSSSSGAVAGFTNSAGTCSLTPSSSSATFSCTSDERLKKDIKDISGQDVLDWLTNLQAVTYSLKKGDNGERHTGYIAQKVQKIAPEFVTKGPDGFLQVSYTGFIPWITEAIKELNHRSKLLFNTSQDQTKDIAAVKAEIAAKDKELVAFKTKAAKLEKENADIKARLERIEKKLLE